MDRKEFDNLTIDKQIELINTKLVEYKSLTQVCKIEKLRRNTIRDRFQNHGYKLVDGQFIKVNDLEEIQAASVTKVPKEITKTENNSNEDTIGMIKAIQKELDQLKEEVQKLKNEKSTPCQSNTTLNIMTFTGTSENKSFRVDSKVVKEFNSFCKKYKEYKKQDLLSQALKEFIDKYK